MGETVCLRSSCSMVFNTRRLQSLGMLYLCVAVEAMYGPQEK